MPIPFRRSQSHPKKKVKRQSTPIPKFKSKNRLAEKIRILSPMKKIEFNKELEISSFN